MIAEQPQNNRLEALGLPPGSVRAILALVVVISAAGLAIWLQELSAVKELALLAMGFYFGTKVK